MEALRVHILRKIGTFRGLWKMNKTMFWFCFLRDYGIPGALVLAVGLELWWLYR